MRYHVLAADYDGTLAHDGRLDAPTAKALRRLKESGRKLVLVTGRELDQLLEILPEIDCFDRVVAENGAILYRPLGREEQPLAEAPPPEFVERLRAKGVGPISVGRVIVATWQPHQSAVLETIREMGLELQVIFNKGAVMILPSGVNKASGLTHALAELGLSPHNAAAVGDAENDHAFLAICECAAAVSNALDTVKERVDWVAAKSHGAGVAELIEGLEADDLASLEPKLTRHHILIGTREDGREVRIPPHGRSVLVAGTSGGGKSTLTSGLLERLAEAGYQFAIVGPEGDDADFEAGVATADRQRFSDGLLPKIQELRARTGRPHWLVLDEAHHLPPWAQVVRKDLGGMLSIAVHPGGVARPVLDSVDLLLAVGEAPEETVREFREATDRAVPEGLEPWKLEKGEALAWWVNNPEPPFRVRSIPPKSAIDPSKFG